MALVDVTVVQGEPRTIAVKLPSGYELTSISGSSLETSDAGGQRDGTVVLTVGDPAARRHQFLVSLERPHDGGSFTLDTGFPSLPDVQRERGEIAIEGVGTLELSAADRDGMHRIDVRELNQALQSLSRLPILSAFRYQRSAVPAGLALDAKRFTDAGVLAAFADFAVATTLVTAEGRALTEVLLQVQNRAQAFLRVTLPPGASIVSADVAGEAAKPVLGADGTRVPLLRPGFRPKGPYTVSFVYLNTGTPFARKGDMSMRLPKMDMPVGIVEWEVFVPDSYSVRAVDGNVIERSAMDRELRVGRVESSRYGASGGVVMPPAANALPGQIRGRTTDRGGAALAGVTIMLDAGGSSQTAITRSDGTFVLSGVPSGPLTVTAQLAGFALASRSFVFDQQPRQLDFTMSVGQVAETVTVTGESPKVAEAQKQLQPSQNVISLQRRAAGVLPIRIDVPRAGTSHQFVKPLVVDQETVVNFRYKRR